MITQSANFFINSFTMKYKTKIKVNRNKKPSVREYTSNCHSYLGLFINRYCLHVEIIPANMGLDRCTTIIIFYV